MFQQIPSLLSRHGFTDKDLSTITENGISLEDILHQVEALTRKPSYPSVKGAATKKGDDPFIKDISVSEAESAIEKFQCFHSTKKYSSVIPAAGAATRQFQLLKTVLEDVFYSESSSPTEIIDSAEYTVEVLNRLKELSKKSDTIEFREIDGTNLKNAKEVAATLKDFWNGIKERKFAFCDELDKVLTLNRTSLDELIENKDIKSVMKYILSEDGLNYENLPKALLLFHSYETNEGTIHRTAFEEHLIAQARLFKDSDTCEVHFMISEEHRDLFEKKLKELKSSDAFCKKISEFGFNFDDIKVTFSYQKESTNAVALDIETGELSRNEDGTLLLRQAGHGALLENLNDLEKDAFWLSNIDNIPFENPVIVKLVTFYKQMMAGMALELEEIRNSLYKEVFDAKERIEPLNDQELNSLFNHVKETLWEKFKIKIEKPGNGKIDLDDLCNVLNKPIVVAGYVPLADGQKGGGPFVVERKEEAGTKVSVVSTLEGDEFELGQDDPNFENADYFHPVFSHMLKTSPVGAANLDMTEASNPERYFISKKAGKKVYETGLWNKLEYCLQVSIAIPEALLNAIKTVAGKESFLSKLHQPNNELPISKLDMERNVCIEDLAKYIIEHTLKA